jgi:threonine synthase
VAVPDRALTEEADFGTAHEGIDFSPEGGAALAAAADLRRQGVIAEKDQVVIFNTGAGWLYRDSGQLPSPTG